MCLLLGIVVHIDGRLAAGAYTFSVWAPNAHTITVILKDVIEYLNRQIAVTQREHSGMKLLNSSR